MLYYEINGFKVFIGLLSFRDVWLCVLGMFTLYSCKQNLFVLVTWQTSCICFLFSLSCFSPFFVLSFGVSLFSNACLPNIVYQSKTGYSGSSSFSGKNDTTNKYHATFTIFQILYDRCQKRCQKISIELYTILYRDQFFWQQKNKQKMC